MPSTGSVRRRPEAELRVTRAAVRRFRLRRHHLLERAPRSALFRVVGAIGGVQAQLESAASLALWARVDGVQEADLDRALRAEPRPLAKAWCMRRTLHVVPSEALATFARGTAGRAEKEIRWVLRRGVPEAVLAAVLAAALDALGRPRTRNELAAATAHALGQKVSYRTGGGWGNSRRLAGVKIGPLRCPADYLLHLLGAGSVICSGPVRGGEATFVRADAWLPSFHDLPRARAEEELMRVYFRAFGPATLGDFVAWSRVLRRGADATWARIAPEFVAVDVDGEVGWVARRDLGALARAEEEAAPPRLLPHFDTFLLGHLGRDHLVAAAHHRKVYRPQGWVSPSVLVDGRVVGAWACTRSGRRLSVTIDTFEPVRAALRRDVEREAAALAGFLDAGGTDVRWRPR